MGFSRESPYLGNWNNKGLGKGLYKEVALVPLMKSLEREWIGEKFMYNKRAGRADVKNQIPSQQQGQKSKGKNGGIRVQSFS